MRTLCLALRTLTLVTLAISAMDPVDRFTRWLEVTPVRLGVSARLRERQLARLVSTSAPENISARKATRNSS